jgi:hypothetical protein
MRFLMRVLINVHIYSQRTIAIYVSSRQFEIAILFSARLDWVSRHIHVSNNIADIYSGAPLCYSFSSKDIAILVHPSRPNSESCPA